MIFTTPPKNSETRADSRIPSMPNLDALASSDSTGQMPMMEQAFGYRLERMQRESDRARDLGIEVQAAMESKVRKRSYPTCGDRLWIGSFELGMGRVSVLPGDEVWISEGASTLFILRRCEADRRYRLFGQCYVQGMMRGEAFLSEYPEWEYVKIEWLFTTVLIACSIVLGMVILVGDGLMETCGTCELMDSGHAMS